MRGLANTTLTNLIQSQCGVIVPENELKILSLQPAPGTFRFDAADGSPERPTPYDSQCQAKPLREAIAAALRAAPMRG